MHQNQSQNRNQDTNKNSTQKDYQFVRNEISKEFVGLRKEVRNGLNHRKRKGLASRGTLLKASLIGFTFLLSYILLFSIEFWPMQMLLALFSGVSLLLFALNMSHEAAHRAFSRVKWKNDLFLILPFSILGVDPLMWRLRHLKSHHQFPNVDGCDADIDQNPFIRLSPHQPKKSWHRFQKYYAWFLYLIVAPHAVWVQDFNYMTRKSLANIHDWQKYRTRWPMFLLLKIPHVLVFYILPILYLTHAWWQILIVSLLIQGVISLLFILPLIGTHFSSLAEFPSSTNRILGIDYVTHQLVTSVDWMPFSRLANHFIGGLNAHAAHHLFPEISHCHYAKISKKIAEFCQVNELPHKHASLMGAIQNHYRFLRMMAR